MGDRILVGTLRTVENEYEACIAAIASQTNQNFIHFVVRDLPDFEAHRVLYSRFMGNADEFDFFIKIDADMVLCSKRYFHRVVRFFAERPEVDQLSVAVLDFFCGRLIGALHAFRSTVTWKVADRIFTDGGSNVPYQQVYDTEILAPAAFHCRNPSRTQALRWGTHRGVKIIEAMRRGEHQRVANHMRNRDAAWLRYISTQDERVLLALYALELTLLNEKAMIEASNYVDLANEIEAEIHNMAAGKVFRAATNLKFRNKSLISDDRYASCPARN